MPKFIVLWVICLSLNLQAQHSLGFRAGSNFANVSTTEEGTITKEKIFGANVGLFLALGVGKKMAIQPELSFIKKGYRTKIQLFEEKNYSTKLNYFDLSLLFKIPFKLTFVRLAVITKQPLLMNPLPYHTIPSIPDAIASTTIIARFVDGLGFRYHWATEGLTDLELAYRPTEDSMNMLELLNHIYDMAKSTDRILGGVMNEDKRPESFAGIRESTLRIYAGLSTRLKEMDEAWFIDFHENGGSGLSKYPFWNFLNGPIADSLTHVGQISSWRRIAGNPQPKGVNVFLGTYAGE